MSIKPRIVVGATPGRGRPGFRLILFAIGVLCAVFFAGRMSVRSVAIAVPERAERAVATERDRLAQEITNVRRGAQVTSEAYDALRREVVQLEASLGEAQADVAFYQRLLGAGGGQRGLAVHALRLRPTASERVYRFRLTLSQNLAKATLVDGRFSIALEGVQGDRMVEVGADGMALRLEGSDGEFHFKYFQEFSGSLSLPEGFVPERVIVRLDVEARDAPVLRSFEWARLLAPEDPAPLIMEER